MSITLNWQNGLVVGAIVGLCLWWMIHRIRRTFEDRCPQCGCLRQEVTFYMEPADTSGAQGILHGHYYMTYKFLECRRHDHVRCHTRGRHVSSFALWLKKNLKPWQLRRTQKVEHLMEISGVHGPAMLGIYTRKMVFKIPRPSQQKIIRRRGFPKN